MKAILGRKLGMTRIFDHDSNNIPVTLIQAGPCYITQIKLAEKDGYCAIQFGFGKKKLLKKPELGHLKKTHLNITPQSLKEFHVNAEDLAKYKLGDEVNIDIFQQGDKLTVSGVSKGKGFAGTVKRHGFRLGPKTHGGDNYRLPGSIGSTFPQRVTKGKRMAGHLGAKKVTLKNLPVIEVNKEKNLLVVKGSIPGPKHSLLLIRG